MKIDFSTIDEATDFKPLPEGRYLCVLDNIDETTTKESGADLWKLRFRVIDGEFTGRTIFDNMVFSEKALKRVKLMCSRLGLDVSKEMDLVPSMIKGKNVFITVEIGEYEDPQTGKKKPKNVVPFAGYDRADTIAAADGKPEAEAPPF